MDKKENREMANGWTALQKKAESLLQKGYDERYEMMTNIAKALDPENTLELDVCDNWGKRRYSELAEEEIYNVIITDLMHIEMEIGDDIENTPDHIAELLLQYSK
jgi:hypothetical protein